jgi:hypothetical protein
MRISQKKAKIYFLVNILKSQPYDRHSLVKFELKFIPLNKVRIVNSARTIRKRNGEEAYGDNQVK